MSEGFVVPPWLRVTEEDLLRERVMAEEKWNRFIEWANTLPVSENGTISIPYLKSGEDLL